MKKTIRALLYTAAFGAMLALPANAYLDPATTSYLIPTIIAVFVACGTAIGIFWKRICLFFRKKKMQRLEKKYARIGEQNLVETETTDNDANKD